MKKFFVFSIVAMMLVIFCGLAVAGANNTIFRKRAEWVKLNTLSKKQLSNQMLQHPYHQMATEQMTTTLTTLSMNQAQILKKGFTSSEIFTQEEARRFAPHIVSALAKAQTNQVVNVSVIHKRPASLLRHDYLSQINVYVRNDELHFYFLKLFARIDGDYEQASNLDEAMRKAKELRVSLAAQPGQTISANGREITIKPDLLVAQATETAATATDSSAQERLKKLDELKQTQLISEEEYQKKRQEILDGI